LFAFILYHFKVVLSCIIKGLLKNSKNFTKIHTNDMYVLIKGKLTIFLITKHCIKKVDYICLKSIIKSYFIILKD